MNPPPSEPFRPVGPVGGETFIEQVGRANPVHRRRGREEETDAQRDERRREERHHDLLATWRDQQTSASIEPGAYDDHGRLPASEHEPTHGPHFDTTA